MHTRSVFVRCGSRARLSRAVRRQPSTKYRGCQRQRSPRRLRRTARRPPGRGDADAEHRLQHQVEARQRAELRLGVSHASRMTRAHTAMFAAVCVMWLAACGREPVPPIRIGTFPGPTSELVFLAQHRGWLPSSEYRLVEFINDGEVMRAFRNGSIEAAFISLDEVLSLAESGLDPVILFVTAESRGGDAIVSHPDVTSFADLRGRRVAVQVNSVSAYLLRRSLKAAGLSVQDLQIVNLPPDRHRAAFMRRDVDAVVTTEPVRTTILDLGGVELF